MHPVLNCRDTCFFGEIQLIQDFVLEEEFNQVCRCQCPHCRSGVTLAIHLRLDCIANCQNSPVIR